MTKRTRTINNFYCSQKFTWLTVDLEKRSTNSCCAATPAKIDLSWLEKNPGNLFNTPALLSERQDMLNNIPVASCEKACWSPESHGLASRRTMLDTAKATHTKLESQPEILSIILGSTCNLTCSYCDKQYSTAWLRDIVAEPYLDIPKFHVTAIDKVTAKISQNEQYHSAGFNMLMKEIETFSNLKKIYVSGGEPFLYNTLPDLLNKLDPTAELIVYTGLGVNTDRLAQQLDKIIGRANLNFVVSAENSDQFYEFNRYGNKYDHFCKNLNLLKTTNSQIKFSSVVSNLTIHGLIDFVNLYGDSNINYQFCNDPDFLQVSVMDTETKQQLISAIEASAISAKDDIIKNIKITPTAQQKTNCQKYLNEFARRRNLNLDIFPSSMLQWLNTKETSHVV